MVSVLDLGMQALTGVFPRHVSDPVSRAPLELVWCPESGLVQLAHSFDLTELYGPSYGYRSGLNASMVTHLNEVAATLMQRQSLEAGDIVVDIGSNDATLLRAFDVPGVRRLGIDPTGEKFRHYYPSDVALEVDFFSAAAFRRHFPTGQAAIVTALGMFYDLEDPVSFVRDVRSILAPDGLWHFEQSYLPSMLSQLAYDTVCHEHLEYYAFAPVRGLLEANGLRVIDVSLNATNGGSFAVTAGRDDSSHEINTTAIAALESREAAAELDQLSTFRRFAEAVARHRDELVALLQRLRAEGRTVIGYGASTKGNVLLQYCGFGPAEIECIAEVNEDKFGAVTPGTGIPIVSEAEAKQRRPDYLLVLPWHFRDAIVAREREFLRAGGKLIFPLPCIEIVAAPTAELLEAVV